MRDSQRQQDESGSIGVDNGRFALSQVYQAAKMYYIEDATQVQIAARLEVSRPTVSRLVAEARRIGIVKIDVADPFKDHTVVLAKELQGALGINAVYLTAVTHPSTLGADLQDAVGRAIRYMDLKPGDAMLLSSGRTTYELAHSTLPPLVGVNVAPAVGGQTEPLPWFQTNETTRVVAEKSGALPSFIFAQALPSAAMRATLNGDPAFQEIVKLWDTAKGALLGIGAPPVKRDALSRGIPVEDLMLESAAGDVCLNFFDEDGTVATFPGSDIMVNISVDVLRRLPHPVGVAVGLDKVTSILGAVRAGLIKELVTDVSTATAILEHLRSFGSAPL